MPETMTATESTVEENFNQAIVTTALDAFTPEGVVRAIKHMLSIHQIHREALVDAIELRNTDEGPVLQMTVTQLDAEVAELVALRA